jgi:hypothetical protein
LQIPINQTKQKQIHRLDKNVPIGASIIPIDCPSIGIMDSIGSHFSP